MGAIGLEPMTLSVSS